MFKNYLKIAWRNIVRQKGFSIINIAGLALGIAVFILIAEYCVSEWSVNRFHKNYSNLYRANLMYKDGKSDYYLAAGLAPMLQSKFPAVDKAVRIADGIGNGVLSIEDDNFKMNSAPTSFREEKILYVESSFFQVFSFPLATGSPILETNTLAISQTMADKMFGKENAVGKRVTVSNQFGNLPYTVSAVFKDMPQQSDIQANVLLSIETLANPANRDGNDWADPNGLESGFCNIYLLLKNIADANQLSTQISKLIHSAKPTAVNDKFVLQPLSNLHLAPDFNYPLQTYGNLLLVLVFTAIALLILLIAWINYINLSTAQAIKRSKEVGIRKVLGASRSSLIFQYLTETLLITAASMLIGFMLVNLLQNVFNEFTGKQLTISVLNKSWFIIAGIAIMITGTLLSGGYVAFVVSGYKPIYTIRGKLSSTQSGLSLRKGLVVFQFTISIIFIIATIVLYRQLQYMHSKNLGMQLDQLVVIKGPTVSTDGQAEKNVAFKNQLALLPFVKKYAASNGVPGQGYNFSADGITSTNPQPGEDKKNYSMFICDEHFFDTYGIDLTQGAGFTFEDAASGWNKAQKVIINQKAAEQLGFAKNEILTGKKILWGKPYEIIGVIKDYHHLSLRQAINPTIYLPSVSFVYFTVQMDVTNLASKLETIKKFYREDFADNPFEYFFADEQFDLQYVAEQKLGNVFIASSLVAVLIACMGLFGLATLSAQQRTKEIGIRKVLGASVSGIVAMIAKDFLTLIGLALVIASPIAWWATNQWLQDFAYRTNVSWWIFLLAGSLAVAIAFFTLSYQAIKAAVANPVDSLRQE